MFVFSNTFPVLWKSTFPMFRETHKFEMFLSSHTFPVLWKSPFPMFWELYGFLLHPKYLKTHKFEMFVFCHTFLVLWKSTFTMFWVLGIVWISASCEICMKHLTLECSVYSCFSHAVGNHFLHVLGTIILTWGLMKIFYFWSHFHTKVYAKLFSKEVNLFCSWAQPNISPF